jgi:hypothetical protein
VESTAAAVWCLFGSGVAVSGRERYGFGSRGEPALLRLDECVAREAEPQAIAKAPDRGVLAELAHVERVRQLGTGRKLAPADLQQINRMGIEIMRLQLMTERSGFRPSAPAMNGAESDRKVSLL